MRVSKCKIPAKLQDELIATLVESILFAYIDISEEVTVLGYEEYYLRTNSEQLNLILIKKVDTFLYIDLIGGGGGLGIFGLTSGSEKSFLKETSRMLEEFCKSQGESFEILE